MDCHSNGTFFSELGLLYSLPKYVDKSALVQSVIIDKWKEHPLVKKVLAGETTFERTFAPLVVAYRSGECYTPEFVPMAEEIGRSFEKIVDLSILRSLSGLTAMALVIEEVLTKKMVPISNFRKWCMSWWSFFEPDQLKERRRLAERILEYAQWADKKMEPHIREN